MVPRVERESPEEEFKSRGYQNELLKTCLEKNTIIYLPTGAGKTYIAIMALKHFARTSVLPIAEGGKRSIFLTNTVVLAHQQKNCIERATALKVSVYTGDMNVDAWRKDQWYGEFENNQVIVATCQIVLDVIRHGFIKITDFNLIIFDECHNAQKDHPMHVLMSCFTDRTLDQSQLPRVIGLTGMLTSPSVKPLNVIDDLNRLESTFRSAIATAKGLTAFNEVLDYSTAPKEILLEFPPAVYMSPVISLIEEKVLEVNKMINAWPIDSKNERNGMDLKANRTPSPLKSLKNSFSDFVHQMKDFGVYGASIAALALLVDLELKKRECSTNIMKMLVRTLITRCEEFIHILVYAMDEEDESDEEPMETEDGIVLSKENRTKVLTNSVPKVQKLLMFLQKYVQDNGGKEMKALIFVKRRTTAKCLSHIIKRFAIARPKALDLWPDFMVGNNSKMPDSIESILCNKGNRKALDRFKLGEINLIVSTSVLEEGIDIQECNVVICYDTPETFRSYVQCKGRARMANSQYVIMSPIGQAVKLDNKMKEWTAINETLKKYLVEKAIDRDEPSKDSIDKEFENRYNEVYKCNDASVDHMNAISILNRYCMSLPADQFTQSAVTMQRQDTKGGIIVKILLPIQSKIKNEISGTAMPNIKLAKRSAAWKACVELHKCSELSDNMLPINKKKCLDLFKETYFNHWDAPAFINDKRHLAGTTKNYRLHDIQTPQQLKGSMPQERKTAYLYVINIEPAFCPTNDGEDNTEIFHELFKSARNYGILTTKPLPRLGPMKFYQSFGAIKCTISHVPSKVTIDSLLQLVQLQKFNFVLFNHLLEIRKSFLVYDLKDSYIIVPTVSGAIDWDIVTAFQSWSDLRRKTEVERERATYATEDWHHKVICPWYRSDQVTRYVVTRVREDLVPTSAFPNSDFASYANYVEQKYNEKVVNNNQFMIQVKGITTNFNRINPGQGEDGRKKANTRGPELLIPELCHSFNFPGDLWLKATVIPSILHRFPYLLHAENLRLGLNTQVGLRVADYEPLPVIEKMAKVPLPSEEKSMIINSIVFPNPSDKEAKQLNKREIVPLSQSVDCPWPESDEPLDLERNFDKAYQIEIDYYCNFIAGKMSNMSLDSNNSNNTSSAGLTSHVPWTTQALCDSSFEEKSRIELLTPVEPSRGVEQHELLAAITASRSADVFDMERFEVLGDAFLKFGTSLYLLQKHIDWHEGHLSTIKGTIVSNRNLCYNAINMKLPGMIKVDKFQPKDDWQPPMLKTPDFVQLNLKEIQASPRTLFSLELSAAERELGEASRNSLQEFFQKVGQDLTVCSGEADPERTSMQTFLGRQAVADKVCADCVEAILGCCVKSIGVPRSFKILELFKILPAIKDGDIMAMLDQKLKSPRIRTNISDSDIDSFLTNYPKLEKSIGYNFKDRAYLLQALTHPSYPTNRITGCYQQLEFLGDAVLDFLVTAYIFERCPDMDPGKLTDLRSALVNNVTLACLCVRYNIHVHILSQNAELSESIENFFKFQANKRHEVTEHVQLLMEENDVECKMAEYVEVPKTLGDVFEALIGGIFLDSGNDLVVTWNVIYKLMRNELDNFMRDVPIQVVRKLHEFPNANPEFDASKVDDDVVMVPLRFTCNGEILKVHGFGTNRANAERAAAKVALQKLQK